MQERRKNIKIIEANRLLSNSHYHYQNMLHLLHYLNICALIQLSYIIIYVINKRFQNI